MSSIFKSIISFLTAIFMLPSMFNVYLFGTENINENAYGQVRSDTWVAVDGLGRSLPGYSEVGATDKENSSVFSIGRGIIILLRPTRRITLPKSSRRILKRSGISTIPSGENTYDGKPYHWNEPLFGYYQNLDEYVVRKHAEMIADAGVDVIIFDCTNGSFTWQPAYEVLFKVFDEAIAEGVNVPQIAFMLNFQSCEDTNVSLRDLYNNVYSKGRYKHLWFMWEGKPLIMAHPQNLDKNDATDKAISEFFTFRENYAAYFGDNQSIAKDSWGWCSDYPQMKFERHFSVIPSRCAFPLRRMPLTVSSLP